MSFFVIFWLGLRNPRHIATKSQHLWAVPRQIRFWSILKKSWDLVRPPPIGPNSQLLPKICFESFPNAQMRYDILTSRPCLLIFKFHHFDFCHLRLDAKFLIPCSRSAIFNFEFAFENC